MKKISILLTVAAILITACLLVLFKKGISLSPAVFIKPSAYVGPDPVAAATVQRLFPQFSQNTIWYFHAEDVPQVNEIIDHLRAHLKFHHPGVTLKRVEELDPQTALAPGVGPILYFNLYPESAYDLSKECAEMKRLNYACAVEVSLHKSRRKMKDPKTRHFLLTAYMDSHYFLLIPKL